MGRDSCYHHHHQQQAAGKAAAAEAEEAGTTTTTWATTTTTTTTITTNNTASTTATAATAATSTLTTANNTTCFTSNKNTSATWLLLLLVLLVSSSTTPAVAIQWLALSRVTTLAVTAPGPLSPQICESFYGSLVRQQVRFCKDNPAFMDSVKRGAIWAIDECQFQFRTRRWNCSTLNDEAIAAFKKAFKPKNTPDVVMVSNKTERAVPVTSPPQSNVVDSKEASSNHITSAPSRRSYKGVRLRRCQAAGDSGDLFFLGVFQMCAQ